MGTSSEGLAAQLFYEYVIRGKEDLNILREYIDNNPAHWLSDENYLENCFATGRV
jgi:hypothetical protein